MYNAGAIVHVFLGRDPLWHPVGRDPTPPVAAPVCDGSAISAWRLLRIAAPRRSDSGDANAVSSELRNGFRMVVAAVGNRPIRCSMPLVQEHPLAGVDGRAIAGERHFSAAII